MTVKYIDLLINDGDLSLNSGSEPLFCHDRISIAQDCVHRIIESGLVKLLIAERSPVLRADILLQMELLTETDTRIVPGTVVITEEQPGHYFITADTYEFGSLSRDLP